jgi:hypothetical protein
MSKTDLKDCYFVSWRAAAQRRENTTNGLDGALWHWATAGEGVVRRNTVAFKQTVTLVFFPHRA